MDSLGNVREPLGQRSPAGGAGGECEPDQTREPPPSTEPPRAEIGGSGPQRPGGVPSVARTSHRASLLTRVGMYDLNSGLLGKGNFAVVRLGVHRLVSKVKVAVKIVEKAELEPENLQKILREIEIMRHLSHPHIIRLYQVRAAMRRRRSQLSKFQNLSRSTRFRLESPVSPHVRFLLDDRFFFVFR